MRFASQLARLWAVALVTAACATGVTAQSKVIALTNATIIDGTGAPPRVATVIVENGRIAGINGRDREQIPAGATVVDGRGKYLIPGPWDMHVHHIGGYNDGTKVLPRLVAYGVTGVRDMASPVDDLLRLRAETASGTLLGPQIAAARPILQRPLPFKTPLARAVTDSDARQVVDDLQSKGVDFIKVGDTLTRDAHLQITTESKRVGLPFAGHLPVSVSALDFRLQLEIPPSSSAASQRTEQCRSARERIWSCWTPTRSPTLLTRGVSLRSCCAVS